MGEYRRDPFRDRWVIIAPERAGRPDEFQKPEARQSSSSACPFCAGHEAETPRSILTLELPNAAPEQWSVRTIPNKYPATQPPTERTDESLPSANAPDMALSQSGVGMHEVIIESPRHLTRADELSLAEQELVFVAYQDCLRRAAQNPSLAYGLIFKNQGAAAGASIGHVHSQFLATEWLPALVRDELATARVFYDRHRECLYCRTLRQERALGTRVVCQSANFTCIAPFASRFPYETWLLPNEHTSRFEDLAPGQLGELASCLHDVMVRLGRILVVPTFNFWLHTAPFDTANSDHYHWHIEIIPRNWNVAGFEWGTDCVINIVSPEAAAKTLRDCC